MPYITATDRPVYWAVVVGNKTLASDITEPGGATITGNDKLLPNDVDENAFLGKVAGKAGSYNPLPSVGEWCEAKTIYAYNNGLVICRQSHARTIYTPEETPALFIVYREEQGVLEWVAGERVEVGTHRMYQNIEYICLQAHVTQSDWTPPVVPALWRGNVAPSPEWQVGVAYKIGDIVLYQSVSYRCIQAHTSQVGWTPPAVPALWARV